MNILWVKAGGLLPLTSGGRTRSYNILRWLAGRHSVSVFTYYAAQEEDPHSQLSKYFEHVECIPIKLPEKKSISDYLAYGRNFFSMQPYSISKYYDANVAKRLRTYLSQNRCDVLICDFLFSAPVIPWDVPCAKVFFSHNVEALIWQRQYQIAKSPLWKTVCWRESRLMARIERQYMCKADHVLTVSEADRKVFAEFLDPNKITVIPTGVDTDYFRPSPDEEAQNTLVFTGSMDWLPNEDAVLYFTREILPSIQQQIPDVSLWIVGRAPTRQIRDLQLHCRNVYVTGTVEDVRPYIAKATVCIVPIRAGSGTRLKIFEAMSMAKAVVSTWVGAEGLPVSHGQDILLANEKEEFANAVLDLLRNAERRKKLGAAARALVESKYGSATVGAVFEQSLINL